MSYSRPSPYFFLPVILVQVDFNPLFQKLSGLSDVFFGKDYSGHICTLWWTHLLLRSLLLIVDFDSDTSTSLRVFFSWLDVMKGDFFTIERILQSSITIVLCGHPGLFMLLSSPVHSFFFSECTKLLIWQLLMFLLSIWWICFDFEA